VPESRGGGSDGHHDSGYKPRPPRGAPKWFQEFEKRNDARWTEQREFNQVVIKKIDEQGNDIKTIQSDISNLKARMIKVEKRLDRVDDVLEYNIQAGVLRAPK
jgi:hypothetical protein